MSVPVPRSARASPQSSVSASKLLPQHRPKATHNHILNRITAILGAYRKDELADPDSWTLQVATLLASFPAEVVDYVTDPITGVQSHVKFGVPNLADIREACDERMAQLRTNFDRENPRPLTPPPMDRSNRPTYDELKARFGPNWGLRSVDDAIAPRTE